MTKKNEINLPELEKKFHLQAPHLKSEMLRCLELIETFLEKKGKEEFGLEDLNKVFRLPNHLKTILQLLVDRLAEQGFLKKHQELYQLNRDKKPLAVSNENVGKISLHPNGFGFVTLSAYDVFIPKHLVLHAMDQDIVEVEILSLEGRNKKGPEGRVVAVVKRHRATILGVVVEIKPGSMKVRASLQGESQLALVPLPAEPVTIGDRILLEVHSLRNQLHLTYQSTLGSIYNPLADLQAIKEEYSLPGEFSQECLNEALSYPSEITALDHPDRIDHTDLFTATIDPKTAKDFDDALSIERTKQGYKLYVHVADASYYVKKDGFLDQEAIRRKNTVYLLGTCIPMLPHVLADNLCSLKQGVNRLAVTVEMDIDAKGHLIGRKIYRSIIKSRHRLSYEEAFEIMHQGEPSPLKDKLNLMKELALHFKAIKHARGSVDLSLSELVWRLGEDGVPTGFEISHYDITHQLVEEFMLKANEVIATEIKNRDVALIYRVHEQPSPETLKEFRNFCVRLGIMIPDTFENKDLARVFEEHRDSAFIQELSSRYIRSMRLATYSTDGIGHHGLMLENYTHFTSPIRRYVDIIIHRLLFNETYTQEELDLIAQNSSEKERQSARAEMSYLALKKLRYIERKAEKEPERTYKATVTRVKPFGVVFDIKDFGIEGFLHISKLGEDYFEFNPKKEVIRGKRTQKSFEIGFQFIAQVESVNLLFQEISWKMVPKEV
ncbi:MAG: ribonuclease R family protein [Chlamydiia bacterium]